MFPEYRFRDKRPKHEPDLQDTVLFVQIVRNILQRYERDTALAPENDDFMAVSTLILRLEDASTDATRLERLMRQREKPE